MTGKTESTLYCDRKTGEQRVCGTPFHFEGSVTGARFVARQVGWHHAGQHDYCPPHAPGRS